MTVGTICRQHAFSKKRNPVSFPVSYYIGYDAKIIWKIIWKSPRAFCFLINNAVWVQTMQKLFEKSSETNRKTERIARLNVRSTNSQIQPNTRTAQCSRSLKPIRKAELEEQLRDPDTSRIILSLYVYVYNFSYNFSIVCTGPKIIFRSMILHRHGSKPHHPRWRSESSETGAR